MAGHLERERLRASLARTYDYIQQRASPLGYGIDDKRLTGGK
jgi:hypothetical protein